MDTLETFEQDGWKATLVQDGDPMSPDDWDNLATFEHSSNYMFGTPTADPSDTGRRSWQVYCRWLSMFGHDVAAVLPVRLEDYGSGLKIHETDAESANGVLFTTHARLNELASEAPEYHSREWATNALRGELEVWAQYIEGDVYGYVITDPAGNDVDSLWGMYGFDYARTEAEEALTGYIAEEAREVERIARITAL